MYNTRRVIEKKEQESLRKEDILAKVTDYAIFAKYIGDFKIGRIYNSPLRDDKNPSFGIFVDKKTGDLLYKDLASGDCGDVFKLVKKIKNLTTYKETLIEISKDLNLNSIELKLDSSQKRKVRETVISIVRKSFTKEDVVYWNEFGISEETLKLFQVSAISKYVIDNVVKASYKYGNPMYAYKVFNKFKIYRPLESKINKWRGNLGNLDIQGFEQLPENGDLLIITKSLKDVMTLHELGYTSVAPASESTLIPEIVMNNLKSRFKRIILFYDRDKTGMSFTRKMVSEYRIDFMFIKKQTKLKDISDYLKKNGSIETKLLLTNMIS